MTNQTVIQTREIRVFLSATFRDTDAERTYLVKQVFPKVRAACLARQVGFSEIDLRWGVSEEESKNGATVEICLKEIDRCRDFPPFFVGFLGERYGWARMDEVRLSEIGRITRKAGADLYIHGSFGSRRITFTNKQKRDECIYAITSSGRTAATVPVEFEGT